MAGSTGEVIKSLVVNAVIASSKGVGAAITGSGSMLAETLHSFSDCGNQLLLLVGIKQSHRAPDAKHPFGYGRNMYFYSFIVALLLFSGGGVFSIYEGIHKLGEPEPVGDLTVAFVILGIALLLEGWSTLGNIKVLNERRASTPFFQYLKESKDSDLVVVFGENSAAVLGLVFALVALIASVVTDDGRWDAVGSLAIGVVLIGVAVFLAGEIKALLVGEAADSKLIEAIQQIATRHPQIEEVFQILSTQQGPGEVMVAMKMKFKKGCDLDSLIDTINQFEMELRKERPEAKWCFIEPDRDVAPSDVGAHGALKAK
jgi:cation diffusion facilitator family transporter